MGLIFTDKIELINGGKEYSTAVLQGINFSDHQKRSIGPYFDARHHF